MLHNILSHAHFLLHTTCKEEENDYLCKKLTFVEPTYHSMQLKRILVKVKNYGICLQRTLVKTKNLCIYVQQMFIERKNGDMSLRRTSVEEIY